MIPDSVETVAAFLLLIAPGYVWQTRAAKYLPELKASALREATRIVFASLIPSILAALLVLTLLRDQLPVLRADPDPLHVVIASITISAVACLFAYLGALFHFRKERRWASQISGGSALYKALTQYPENSKVAQVLVTARLKDGTVWRGAHMAHDVEAEVPFRTLFLAPPLVRRNATTGTVAEYGTGNYVVIPLDQVSSLQLKYRSGKESGKAEAAAS
ncbi:hypothetical protein CFK39_06500 [Brachybacterium avium]|uniref:Uncharacterized protein n=1 Tax=Brachybacterium avium TaxID=2017485 RepID=A0A220UC93_9MICO|nr:DUF6338 family protein [Brachybacterium avium]ASK65542.1 hypothetical protein CFK39_06500 [Brachybacterium avium]